MSLVMITFVAYVVKRAGVGRPMASVFNLSVLSRLDGPSNVNPVRVPILDDAPLSVMVPRCGAAMVTAWSMAGKWEK